MAEAHAREETPTPDENPRCSHIESADHMRSLWRLPGGPWICNICHPCPYPPEVVEKLFYEGTVSPPPEIDSFEFVIRDDT